MIRAIIAYGDPVLRKKAEEVDLSQEKIDPFISDMFDTMYHAEGVGLAAPQIGESKRIFIVDASPFKEDNPDLEDFKKVFINPLIIEETGDEWEFNEGCLSIPGIREDVKRKSNITISYYDENLQKKVETYSGIAARIIQHEYDHLEGILFTDRLSHYKRSRLRKKLQEISKGNVKVHYKMKFPKK
jgi:peptide deformylase